MEHVLEVESHLVRAAPVEFTSFYAAEWQGVFRPLAVILRDADLAHEATDEAMTRAYQHWPRVRSMDNPPGWVYRVALNWSRTQLRRRAIATRLLRHGTSDLSEPVVEPGLVGALGHLPMRQREVVVLRYVLDWSEAEITAALGIPRGTVKSRLHRALAHLRQEMS
jgi:RNA polymerase sigma-70 factor (ECF subfamily)